MLCSTVQYSTLTVQQTWNLSQTVHGHMFLEKVLLQNFAWIYDFLGHEENIYLPLWYLNTFLYTCFYLCYSIFALLDQKIPHKKLLNSKEKRIYNK